MVIVGRSQMREHHTINLEFEIKTKSNMCYRDVFTQCDPIINNWPSIFVRLSTVDKHGIEINVLLINIKQISCAH